MNTHTGKTQENKSESVAKHITQKKESAENDFEFENNRPDAFAISDLHSIANNSHQINQTAQLNSIANNSQTAIQKQDIEDEELLQGKFVPIQKKENNTGLPDNLKTGMENLSGMSLDDIKVHRNSDKPTQLQAHAYAQGTDIHLGPGQEKHLPHEAWHVVQQKQGRVKKSAENTNSVIQPKWTHSKQHNVASVKQYYWEQQPADRKEDMPEEADGKNYNAQGWWRNNPNGTIEYTGISDLGKTQTPMKTETYETLIRKHGKEAVDASLFSMNATPLAVGDGPNLNRVGKAGEAGSAKAIFDAEDPSYTDPYQSTRTRAEQQAPLTDELWIQMENNLSSQCTHVLEFTTLLDKAENSTELWKKVATGLNTTNAGIALAGLTATALTIASGGLLAVPLAAGIAMGGGAVLMGGGTAVATNKAKNAQNTVREGVNASAQGTAENTAAVGAPELAKIAGKTAGEVLSYGAGIVTGGVGGAKGIYDAYNAQNEISGIDPSAKKKEVEWDKIKSELMSNKKNLELTGRTQNRELNLQILANYALAIAAIENSRKGELIEQESK